MRCFRVTCVLLTVAATGCGGSAAVGAARSTAPEARQADTAAGRVAATQPALRDWPTFGIRASRENATNATTGITAENAPKLVRDKIALPGTVDSSPIVVDGKVVVTTTYGRTVALDLATGRRLWTFTPKGIEGWEGSAQITNASPTADPGRRFVYAASPGGRIHKLSLADGSEAGGRWAGGVSVTKDPTHEKLTSSLNVRGGDVLATTGGYIGDAPPYQGHVLAITRSSGRVRAVFNSLCSNRRSVIDPKTCRSSASAIWARSGAVVEPRGRGILVATGNAPFDGRRDWGDSVLRLSPETLRLKKTWTPRTVQELNATDADLGSTAPALLGGGLYLQGGKDRRLHLLSSRSLHRPSGKLGGEVANYVAPGDDLVFTAPAVWHHGSRTTVFVTTGSGTAAYSLRGRWLRKSWANGHAGTSPVVAGGLLYVHDPSEGKLRIYRPGSGSVVAEHETGPGHWGSPVVVGGRVVVPEGNANQHAKTGTLNVYRAP